jgi:hypothetical protein
MFSEVFWTGLYTASGALLIALVNQCYKSKCKEIDICCIKIIRDVSIEEEIDNPQLRANI